MTRNDDQHPSNGTAAGWILVLLAVSSIAFATACSSAPKADEPSILVYVGSSDDTWTAMHIVLIELDYDVKSENRDEGRIRATREAGDVFPASVLAIDQVARHDTISLYFRAAAAAGDPPLDDVQRQALAEEFLGGVKALLY